MHYILQPHTVDTSVDSNKYNIKYQNVEYVTYYV
jgi:hypothetical protein